ncbi:hypothetical protein [Winogradskyella sp. SYSU M77433]|uniref:hypothetical protein n=1 Tax=Winogradskyella sp. SYSU M77433 TaxID=3042722 RepID=UPI0024801950|nr:hypothetical protein [Winogradskyella sp. SYSU M77433]MDH7913273.1 hypothetical protein [Winogradskyella sp. SYSU M77433]
MKKFIIKSGIYIVLILLIIEIIVRVFHLYTEDPPRFIDEYGVEKRVPGNTGYTVFGNRNQSYSRFSINESGFNSHREFNPTNDKCEIAIIGDSFIEGFHQDFDDSTGKKLEDKLGNCEVYEYGYSGYDLANQMHLIHAYKEQFDLIDEVVIYLNYDSDLDRGVYEPNYDRIKMLKSTPFKIRDNIKILAYGSKIGILEPLKRLVSGKAFEEPENGYQTNEIETTDDEKEKALDLQKLSNFKSLVKLYGFNKSKTSFLLDSRKTSKRFLEYCRNNGINYIDFADNFKKSKKATTLIYDWHWNNHGRDIIASTIADYMKAKKEKVSK